MNSFLPRCGRQTGGPRFVPASAAGVLSVGILACVYLAARLPAQNTHAVDADSTDTISSTAVEQNAGGAAPPSDQAFVDMVLFDLNTAISNKANQTEILKAERAVMMPDDRRMELYQAHVDFFDEAGTLQSTLDATTGVFYLGPARLGELSRARNDLDVFGTDGRPVVFENFGEQRASASHFHYNADSKTIGTSQPVALYDHVFGSAFIYPGGMLIRNLSDTSSYQGFGEKREIPYE